MAEWTRVGDPHMECDWTDVHQHVRALPALLPPLWSLVSEYFPPREWQWEILLRSITNVTRSIRVAALRLPPLPCAVSRARLHALWVVTNANDQLGATLLRGDQAVASEVWAHFYPPPPELPRGWWEPRGRQVTSEWRPCETTPWVRQARAHDVLEIHYSKAHSAAEQRAKAYSESIDYLRATVTSRCPCDT